MKAKTALVASVILLLMAWFVAPASVIAATGAISRFSSIAASAGSSAPAGELVRFEIDFDVAALAGAEQVWLEIDACAPYADLTALPINGALPVIAAAATVNPLADCSDGFGRPNAGLRILRGPFAGGPLGDLSGTYEFQLGSAVGELADGTAFGGVTARLLVGADLASASPIGADVEVGSPGSSTLATLSAAPNPGVTVDVEGVASGLSPSDGITSGLVVTYRVRPTNTWAVGAQIATGTSVLQVDLPVSSSGSALSGQYAGGFSDLETTIYGAGVLSVVPNLFTPALPGPGTDSIGLPVSEPPVGSVGGSLVVHVENLLTFGQQGGHADFSFDVWYPAAVDPVCAQIDWLGNGVGAEDDFCTDLSSAPVRTQILKGHYCADGGNVPSSNAAHYGDDGASSPGSYSDCYTTPDGFYINYVQLHARNRQDIVDGVWPIRDGLMVSPMLMDQLPADVQLDRLFGVGSGLEGNLPSNRGLSGWEFSYTTVPGCDPTTPESAWTVQTEADLGLAAIPNNVLPAPVSPALAAARCIRWRYLDVAGNPAVAPEAKIGFKYSTRLIDSASHGLGDGDYFRTWNTLLVYQENAVEFDVAFNALAGSPVVEAGPGTAVAAPMTWWNVAGALNFQKRTTPEAFPMGTRVVGEDIWYRLGLVATTGLLEHQHQQYRGEGWPAGAKIVIEDALPTETRLKWPTASNIGVENDCAGVGSPDPHADSLLLDDTGAPVPLTCEGLDAAGAVGGDRGFRCSFDPGAARSIPAFVDDGSGGTRPNAWEFCLAAEVVGGVPGQIVENRESYAWVELLDPYSNGVEPTHHPSDSSGMGPVQNSLRADSQRSYLTGGAPVIALQKKLVAPSDPDGDPLTPTPVPPGSLVTFAITFDNLGDAGTQGTTIVDPFIGFDFVSVSQVTGVVAGVDHTDVVAEIFCSDSVSEDPLSGTWQDCAAVPVPRALRVRPASLFDASPGVYSPLDEPLRVELTLQVPSDAAGSLCNEASLLASGLSPVTSTACAIAADPSFGFEVHKCAIAVSHPVDDIPEVLATPTPAPSCWTDEGARVGTAVQYEVIVNNTSGTTIHLSSIVDQVAGEADRDLSPWLDISDPSIATLAPGASKTFTFPDCITGSGGDLHSNTVEVMAAGPGGSLGSGSDTEEVRFATLMAPGATYAGCPAPSSAPPAASGSRCGLGFELAFLLPLWNLARRRRLGSASRAGARA